MTNINYTTDRTGQATLFFKLAKKTAKVM